MKKTRIILTVVVALLSLSLLVSCNKKEEDNTPSTDVVYYTVTFDTNGGSEIAPITQDYGTVITAPEAPPAARSPCRPIPSGRTMCLTAGPGTRWNGFLMRTR